MLFDNHVTLCGNVTNDPELRFTAGGMAVCNFGIAQNERRKDSDEERAHFFDVTVFRDLAENVAESLSKGDRVLVDGTIQYRSWETEDGNKRSKVEIVANEVAPSLRWATAVPTRNERASNGASADDLAAAAGVEEPDNVKELVVDGEPF